MSKYKEQYEKETGQFWRFRPGTRLHDIRVSRAYSYWLEKRLEEAEGERERLENRLFGRGEMNNAPCFFCGYNGPGYFQPETHACAAKHHRLFPGTETLDPEKPLDNK